MDPVAWVDQYDLLFHKVRDHMGWDDKKTREWFCAKNSLCGDISPMVFLIIRQEKAERWIESLIGDNSPPS